MVGECTNCSGLNHIAYGKSLDRLVFRCASRAVGAANGLDVAAALLVATAVCGNRYQHFTLPPPPLNRFTTPELNVLGSSLFHHDFGISGSCRFWGS